MLPNSPGNNIFINKSTVFLGGSCNPTTWRKDIAIPMLKALNITYYDPQKDHWEPELIELEDKAKKNAQVLFFVIDNQTRSIASMIEVSFIAATTKKLVLVIDLFPSLEPIINGEPISQYEHDILKGGRKLLMKLVERKGMPVFNQIPAALNYIPIIITRNQVTRSSAPSKTPVIVNSKGSDGSVKFNDGSSKICRSSLDSVNDLKPITSSSSSSSSPSTSSSSSSSSSTTTTTTSSSFSSSSPSSHQLLTRLLSPYEMTKVKEVYDSCVDMYTGCLSLLDTKLAYLMLTGKDLDDKLISDLINLIPTTATINSTSNSITKENNWPSNQFNYNNHHHYQQQKQQPITMTTNLITSNNPQQLIVVDSNLHHNQLNHQNQHSNDTNHTHHQNHHNINNNNHHHQHHHLTNHNNNLDITINFKQFCTLIVDYLQSSNLSNTKSPDGTSHLINMNPPTPTSPNVNYLTPLVNLSQYGTHNHCDNYNQIDSNQRKPRPQQLRDSINNNVTDSQPVKTADIYLGGSDNPKGWRTSIAIPLIDQSNLTYSMPNINPTIGRWDTTGNDLTKLESCQVLLFVIGGQQPELETMILATHYFGQKFKVVLCVQTMPLENVTQDNQISLAAIDDYNRGRAYLSEIARKENIQVFEDLEEAVKCAIKSVKS